MPTTNSIADDANVDVDAAAVASGVAAAFAAALPEDSEDHHVIGVEELAPPVVAAKAPRKRKSLAKAKGQEKGGEGEEDDGGKKKKKRRICKFPGCTKTVKAQGHCQSHGAKTKRCKHPGCNSQAQGSHEGFCKKHWREFAAPEHLRKTKRQKKAEEDEPTTCEPVGSSVYDAILPASFQVSMIIIYIWVS